MSTDDTLHVVPDFPGERVHLTDGTPCWCDPHLDPHNPNIVVHARDRTGACTPQALARAKARLRRR